MERAACIAVHNETKAAFSRVTREGRKITYRLRIIQQPERARACGSGAKSSADRRPVDPPPIVELKIFEGDDEKDITFNFNANYFLFATLEQARPIAQGRVPTDQTRLTVLTGTPVAGLVYLDRPEAAGYFLFPDLSVRHEGIYRLSFNLYEELKNEQDRDRVDETKERSADSGADAHVTHRLEVKSKPFDVFSAKKFPGLAQSTDLSRVVAEQGCRVRIRRDVRVKRRDKPDDVPETYAAPIPEESRGRGSERLRRSLSADSFKHILPSPTRPSSDVDYSHHTYHAHEAPEYQRQVPAPYVHHAHPPASTYPQSAYGPGPAYGQAPPPPTHYGQPMPPPSQQHVRAAPPPAQPTYYQYPPAPVAPPAVSHSQQAYAPHHHQSRSSISEPQVHAGAEYRPVPPPQPQMSHQPYSYAPTHASQHPPPQAAAHQAPQHHYVPPPQYAPTYTAEPQRPPPPSYAPPTSARLSAQHKSLPALNTAHQIPSKYLEPSSPGSAGPSPSFSETSKYRVFGSTDSAIGTGKRTFSDSFDTSHTQGPMRAGARPAPGVVQDQSGARPVDHDGSYEQAQLDRLRSMSYKRADGKIIQRDLVGQRL